MNLASKLKRRETPVRVACIGAGIFGSQVVHALETAPGLETAIIADIEPGKAETTFRRTGVDAPIERAADVDAAEAILDAGGRVVTADGAVAVGTDVDVVLEATGDPVAAATHAEAALRRGVHVVNVSVEADTVCGLRLAALASEHDACYSLAYGDQPAQIVELCEWAETVGLEVVAAGKSSRKLEPYGGPDDAIERHGAIASFGDGLDPNPRMYNTFLDGTKAAVETVSAANATGLAIDEGGVTKPTIPLDELPVTFRPVDEGGILNRTGVMDAVTPEDARFSVFVVTRTRSSQLADYFAQRPQVNSSADGRYQAFVRPHHFASETALSIAAVALLGETTGTPVDHGAEVVATAKRDLEPGDVLDGGGGTTVYGAAVAASWAAEEEWVPFELLGGATVVEPLSRDERVTRDHVELESGSALHRLRAEQDGR